MTDDLTTLHVTDQHAAEVRDTAGLIAAYYERLIATGMPRKAVSRLTESFATYVHNRHFGCDLEALTRLNESMLLGDFDE